MFLRLVPAITTFDPTVLPFSLISMNPLAAYCYFDFEYENI